MTRLALGIAEKANLRSKLNPAGMAGATIRNLSVSMTRLALGVAAGKQAATL
jgi:hypothetical protein